MNVLEHSVAIYVFCNEVDLSSVLLEFDVLSCLFYCCCSWVCVGNWITEMVGVFQCILETLFNLAGVSSLFTVQPPKQLHQ